MKKVTMMFVFAFLMVSIFSVSLAEAAKPKKAAKGGSNSALESNLKTYFSEKMTNANIDDVKVVKFGDVVSVKRRQVLTNNIIEDLERPVLVNIKGKCKYSDTIINENVKQVLHKNEWGEWAIGQGTQTEDSFVSGMLSATFDVQKCPENPEIVAQREREKEAERAAKEAKIAAKEAAKQKAFIAKPDGTIVDARTGLMWAAKDNGVDLTWNNANNYCVNYQGGGYTDWRMPTGEELISLKKSSQIQKMTYTESWIWGSDSKGPPKYVKAGKLDYLIINLGHGDFSGGYRSANFAEGRALPVRGKISYNAETTDTPSSDQETKKEKKRRKGARE